MKIIRDRKFLESLKNILEFIAQDSLKQSLLFNDKLNKKIEELPFMPYKFRESIYHSNNNIRDLIFMGYSIPYLVEEEKIVILNIFKGKKEDN